MIAAQSGRGLAAAARRAGFVPLVADMFGDRDTIAMAAAYRPVRGRLGLGIHEGSVLPALASLAAGASRPPLGVVLGSGFESSPRLIEAIDRRFGVLGASGQAVRRLKDPRSFVSLLAKLNVPHPEISLDAVSDPAGFLQKRKGGSGGGHIRPATANCLPRGFYLQRHAAGRPVSIAFLADGAKALMVGTTDQWTSPSRRSPWRYGGAVEPGHVAAGVAAEVEAAIQGIVRTVKLRGLASADILVDGRSWWMLEINPRPGGTMDALDRRARPLFQRHVEASRGILGPRDPMPNGASGTKVVYAGRKVPVVRAIDWPAYVMDQPQPGSTIQSGAPICTVSATAPDVASVRSLLDARETEALKLSYNGHSGERIVRTA